MSFLWNWLRRKPVQPARIPTDTVIPLHSLDDNAPNRGVALDLSFKYDDVLDPDKLASSLSKLLEKPSWRKIGARLRKNKHGKLEYHIPAAYTKERPAINFTHARHDVPIDEHRQGCMLPKATGELYVTSAVDSYRSLLVSESSPTHMNHWLHSDRAQLSIHVVSFTDATLVTVSWLHTCFDAMGAGVLFKAWGAMLEGREEDIPELDGYDFDPFVSLGAPRQSKEKYAPEEEEFVYKHKILRGWRMFRWVLGFMWELLVYRTDDIRTVIMPDAFFKKLREDTLNELALADPATITMDNSDPAHPRPFLSDGDILAAWYTRLIISSQPWLPSARPSKTIQIMNVFSMRDLLTTTPPQLLSKSKSYVGNCIKYIYSFFTLHEFLALPLGEVAARIRSDLVTQSTRPQTEAASRIMNEAIAKTGQPVMYGDADMMFSVFTNWTKARMFDVDFKAAVVKKGEGEHVVGKPTALLGDASTDISIVRNSGSVAGRDAKGNWWLGCRLRPETWRNVERAIEGMK